MNIEYNISIDVTRNPTPRNVRYILDSVIANEVIYGVERLIRFGTIHQNRMIDIGIMSRICHYMLQYEWQKEI